MRTVVFTFGRMNPPTRGHERLVSTVLETAKKVGGDHVVYLSHTQKSPTDPLNWKFKRRVCEAAFPGVQISRDEFIRTPFQALEQFKGLYEKAILVVGGDQLDEFAARMTPYATKWGLDFEIVSAGNRIDESNDVEGMSATKLRQYALENNRALFYAGLPSKLNENIKRLVFDNTRKELKKT